MELNITFNYKQPKLDTRFSTCTNETLHTLWDELVSIGKTQQLKSWFRPLDNSTVGFNNLFNYILTVYPTSTLLATALMIFCNEHNLMDELNYWLDNNSK